MVSVWVLGDQLLQAHPALLAAEAGYGRHAVRVVMVESVARTRRRPYQRRKLVLLFSAMRHYAAELQARGWQVDYRRAETMLSGLQAHCAVYRPGRLYCMAASEYRGRQFQKRLGTILPVPVQVLANTQFLTGRYDPYPAPDPDRRYVMEHFYRSMRRHFAVLMDDGEPAGGGWNFDRDNRKPLPQKLTLPPPPRSISADEITTQVMEEVNALEGGIGGIEGFDLAVTPEQAETCLEDFIHRRLASFGAYEDAMTTRSAVLFHSRLAPYLNLGLLDPLEVVQAVEQAYRTGLVPINSAEGFIRQVLGWREFIYWQYGRQMPGLTGSNFWNAWRPLPGFFWDGNTAMNCLQHVVNRVLNTGYSHHIERLMVVSNFCLLAGIQPQEVNNWFLSCYIDAYEWVMLPNVLGMGLYADGGLTATKPYIASANYINRMSDYCGGCHYNHRLRYGPEACPFNRLYWNFLIEHEVLLRANPRMGPNVLGLKRVASEEREYIRASARKFLADILGN